MGDVDFEAYLQNIKIKAESNTQLTHFEEITLLLISLNPEFDGEFEILKWISHLLKNKELFDETKFEFFQAVIQLEIENFLTKDEKNEIEKEIKMTPRAMDVVTQAINEVNLKVLAEAREEAREEVLAEGKAKGKTEATENIAKSLRDSVDLNVLADATGLTVEEIKRL